jgi:aldehyde dehydrogenase (NAD+)
MDFARETTELLEALGVPASACRDGDLEVRTPIDGSTIGRVAADSAVEANDRIARAAEAFLAWRDVPAPMRGELVRRFGEQLREHKGALARLVSIESGKIASEGAGEVQEMIDICDLAVGISRQLYGLTIASERRGHHMLERWHPLGVVGVITAFNFPVAVFSWNAALALVCGNSLLWKPSEKTPLTAIATMSLLQRAGARMDDVPPHLAQLLLGGRELGELLADDRRIALLSATGSTRMGRAVAPRVAARFGRVLLELGGNNAMIVTPSADLQLTARAATFAAAGTAGQRCTTLRRLIVHRDVQAQTIAAIRQAYGSLRIGNPLEPGTLVGPLIDAQAGEHMARALEAARAAGGKITGGERVQVAGFEGGTYVRPALVELERPAPIMAEETFAPILYAVPYDTLEEAIAIQNDVPQGLSSCIMTNDVTEAEVFLSSGGSDCGIANVNIGPSGAEVGGAFGGEKETGGGRESGSDSWRAYVRRQTQTVNYSRELPLAQGVKFDIDA